jgi:hypothetical protein
MKLLLPLLFLWISHKQWHTAIILKTIQKYSYIKIQQSTIKYGTYNSMRNTIPEQYNVTKTHEACNTQLWS